MRDSVSSSMETYFTDKRAWQVLEAIANTYAPGQTVSYTRAVKIAQLLQQFQVTSCRFERNYKNTGNAVLQIGHEPVKIWFFAHADEISYLVGKPQADETYELTPFCAHKSHIIAPAVVLRYSQESHTMEVVGGGEIHPASSGNIQTPALKLIHGNGQPGDRVVYAHKQTLKEDRAEGSIDNAAGVTACLLAAAALAGSQPDIPVGFVFSDEEEGPSEQTVSFSRGARRFLRIVDPPELCIVVDGHPAAGEHELGTGARFSEKSGNASSAVTPPHIYTRFKSLVAQLREVGMRINENTDRVSRGDDIALIEATPNILLLGYPSVNRHFDVGLSAAALSDITEVARLVYQTALYFSENLKSES